MSSRERSEAVNGALPLRPSSDLDLATRAAAGDTGATAKLLRKLAPEMLRVVRGVMGGRDSDVDDALQQSLVALIRALPAFRGECAPAGYACRIAFRTALAVRKGVRRRDGRTAPSEEAEAIETGVEPMVDLLRQRRISLVRALLDELPQEQSEALAMRTMLGWSLEEIAASSGAPVNTVRSRLRLAKAAMRRRIEADPDLLEDLGGDR